MSQTPQITFRGAPILSSGRIWKYYTTKIAFQKHDILLSIGMFVFFPGFVFDPRPPPIITALFFGLVFIQTAVAVVEPRSQSTSREKCSTRR